MDYLWGLGVASIFFMMVSFLPEWAIQVGSYEEQLSPWLLQFEMPQDSAISPSLFKLHVKRLGEVIHQLRVPYQYTGNNPVHYHASHAGDAEESFLSFWRTGWVKQAKTESQNNWSTVHAQIIWLHFSSYTGSRRTCTPPKGVGLRFRRSDGVGAQRHTFSVAVPLLQNNLPPEVQPAPSDDL